MIDVLGDVLMVAGATLIALATIGLHRFADFYGRSHAASKATSAGFVLLAIGALAHLDTAAARVELVIAALLLVLTTPVGVHLLARAAHRRGDPAPANLSIDDLAARRNTAESADRDR